MLELYKFKYEVLLAQLSALYADCKFANVGPVVPPAVAFVKVKEVKSYSWGFVIVTVLLVAIRFPWLLRLSTKVLSPLPVVVLVIVSIIPPVTVVIPVRVLSVKSEDDTVPTIS